jgi:hypothetical protein
MRRAWTRKSDAVTCCGAPLNLVAIAGSKAGAQDDPAAWPKPGDLLVRDGDDTRRP